MLLVIADDDQDWQRHTELWLDSLRAIEPIEARQFFEPSEMIDAFESGNIPTSSKIVIFLDIDFSSVGLNGIDTLKALKGHSKKSIRKIPVVMYSKSENKQEIDKSYAAKANSYVSKGRGPHQESIFKDTVEFWSKTARVPDSN